jgi:uncharacterized protein (DUF924 family)
MKDLNLDEQITLKFSQILQEHQNIRPEDFLESPQTSLAAVILFDQFPRNIFRNQAKSFEFDSKALAITNSAIERGYHDQLPVNQRSFLLMPLMHSESIELQNKGVELFAFDSQFQNFGIMHRDIIQKFGRFPHRNEILGRVSTPEELEFLTQEGSSF